MSKLALCLAVMMLVCMIASPISAAYVVTGNYAPTEYPIIQENVRDYIHVSSAENAISVVEYDMQINTRVDFTLTYGTGATVAGYMEYYEGTGLFNSTSTVSLGGMTRTENFYDIQALGLTAVRHVQFSSYGLNNSANPPEGGFTLYAQGFGLFSDEIVFYPVPNTANNLISSIHITATKPLGLRIEETERTLLSGTIDKTISQAISESIAKIGNDAKAWVDFAIGIASTVYEVAVTLLYWLKFFFVDNLGMTVALYLSISLAYTAATSRNIFVFFRKFLNDQRKLFEFVLSLWRALVEIITNFRAIFRI